MGTRSRRKIKKTQKDITELTVEDIEDLIADRYGGTELYETTEITFTLKDVSDSDERYSRYILDGATVTVSREVK